MSEYRSQIQNLFLSTVRKRHQPVEVVLDTGTCLRGIIKGFDQFSVTIGFHDKLEVIYKSAILYITAMPKKSRSRSKGSVPRPSGMGRPPRYSADSRPPYDDDCPPRPCSFDSDDSRLPRLRPAPEIIEERPARPRSIPEPKDEQPPRHTPEVTGEKPTRSRTRTSASSTEKPPVRTPPPRQFIDIPEDIDLEDPPPPKKTTRKSST